MANPQPDIFLKISVELFEAIMRTHFPGNARMIFDYVIRMTYGYHRKTFETSQYQISKDLKIPRPRVSLALKWLKSMKMLNGNENVTVLSRNTKTILSIQKDFDRWGNGNYRR